MDELLDCEAWFGYGTKTEINTGSGFGAIAGQPFIKTLLDSYTSLSYDSKLVVCTKRDTAVFKETFPEFKSDGSQQVFGNIVVLGNIWHYVIHHYTNTWMTKFEKWRSQNKI